MEILFSRVGEIASINYTQIGKENNETQQLPGASIKTRQFTRKQVGHDTPFNPHTSKHVSKVVKL